MKKCCVFFCLKLCILYPFLTGNILLNVMLSASLPASRQGKNNVFIVCVPNPPISGKPDAEADTTPTPMLIRVKTGDDADELLGKIDERKKLLE